MTAELIKIEFQLTSHSRIVRDIIKYMNLVIYVLDIFQRRERDCFQLTEPLYIRAVP